MKIILKNSIMYDKAVQAKSFLETKMEQLPARCAFYIYKNLNALIQASIEIDKVRENIIKTYGEQQEDESYEIPKDKVVLVNKELNDLSNIEQTLEIYPISLDDFKDTKLTFKDTMLLDFMVEMPEEKEEENEND